MRKYTLYAIGEISLVVIGILIALQINNWNEERKESLLETKLLFELREGLLNDLVDVNLNIDVQTNALKSQNIIIDWLDSGQPMLDSLEHHFAGVNMVTHFAPSDGPYHSLQQTGMRTIRNDTLRNLILDVYDFLYEGYSKNNNFYIEMLYHTYHFVNPTYFDNVQIFDLNHPDYYGKMKPKSEAVIRSEGTYRYHIDLNRHFNDFILNNNMVLVRNKIEELIQMIENELELN
jgi:hypothetical protein